MCPVTNSPQYIGSREACRRLLIDRSTLSRWVAAGKITPVLRLDGPRGAFVFAADAVDDLMRSQTATATERVQSAAERAG